MYHLAEHCPGVLLVEGLRIEEVFVDRAEVWRVEDDVFGEEPALAGSHDEDCHCRETQKESEEASCGPVLVEDDVGETKEEQEGQAAKRLVRLPGLREPPGEEEPGAERCRAEIEGELLPLDALVDAEGGEDPGLVVLDAREPEVGDLAFPDCGLDCFVELKRRSLEVFDERVPVGEDRSRE